MQSAVPKQFLPLNGLPVLMHTIDRHFTQSASHRLNIILVLHASYHDYVESSFVNTHQFTIPHHALVTGGETRFHSVKNAVDLILDNNVLIAVHDAVRPLVSGTIIDEAYQCAGENGTAVIAVKSRDSIRKLNGTTSTSLNRDEIYLVQTPQTFQSALLKEAYNQPYNPNFTDDASVVEHAGTQITLIEGNYSNIKITFPEDITIAEALINKKSHQ
jgi:2-C-methyl-D-erythritol 4-phosphate cytidylyltransferase